jgi:WD40 repeat protein
LWDLSRGEPAERAVLKTEPGSDEVLAFTFTPDCKALDIAGKTLSRWDLAGAQLKKQDLLEMEVSPGGGRVSWSVVFAPNGKALACDSSQWSIAASDEWVDLWDVTGEKPAQKLRVGPPGSLAFTPDSTVLACAGSQGELALWDLAKKAKARGWQLPASFRAAAFAPDGRHLALANVNGTVYILRVTAAPNP